MALACALLAPAVPPPVAASIRFEDAADDWGIRFRHHLCASGQFYMVESMGSGVVVFDYDGDGDDDLFFVDTGLLPGCTGEVPRSVLYRNDGGSFADVTERSGIEVDAYGMGGAAGDVDGDGDLDLYVTAFGANQLFVNDGDGSFHDGTARAGVGDELWGASATFADLDLDGDLDLYVTNYVDFTLDDNKLCGLESRRLRSYCHPDAYGPLPDRLYRNRGDGTFDEVSREAGVAVAPGNGLGVLAGDLTGDALPDLYVANDMTPNRLFAGRGDGTFEEIGLLVGAALSDQGLPEAGMGVAVGDLDGDAQPELIVTHLDGETNAVYSRTAAGTFVDRRFQMGVARPSVNRVGFGVVLADFDQDADLDLGIANGHIIHNIELWGRNGSYAQPNQVLANDGRGRFAEVAESGLEHVRVSRGLATGDLDGDGDLDWVASNNDDLAEVYRNVSSPAGGWLQIDLASRRPGTEAFGIGAVLELATGDVVQRREVRTSSSYLSQSALTAHFGLGAAAPGRLTLRLPGGARRALDGLPADRRLRLYF